MTFALIVGKCCRVLSRHLWHLMWNLRNVFIFQLKEWTESSRLSIFTLPRILHSLLYIPLCCPVVGKMRCILEESHEREIHKKGVARLNNSCMKVLVSIIGQLQQGTGSISIRWNLNIGHSKCQLNLFNNIANVHVLSRLRYWEH